ncbi:hypothetical protein C0J52_11120 [Blattella germanica]|nr:hypothetical protein C0J52_11120 [Blattella germanica]
MDILARDTSPLLGAPILGMGHPFRLVTFIPPRDFHPTEGLSSHRGTYNPARDIQRSEGHSSRRGTYNPARDIQPCEGHTTHHSVEIRSSAIICCDICAFTLSLRLCTIVSHLLQHHGFVFSFGMYQKSHVTLLIEKETFHYTSFTCKWEILKRPKLLLKQLDDNN